MKQNQQLKRQLRLMSRSLSQNNNKIYFEFPEKAVQLRFLDKK
ncbi:hypothetical protein VYH70_10355 [Streptococcus anginosus]|nr:hypothetical protein [Streptococcus anginosus]MED5945145.1 hypothetical protein [Streptococcus anginosus]MED5959088.1 hypothetical protein [Streptococcus anginosus]